MSDVKKEMLDKLAAATTKDKQTELLVEVMYKKLDPDFMGTITHICKLEKKTPMAAAINLAYVVGTLAAIGLPEPAVKLNLDIMKVMMEAGVAMVEKIPDAEFRKGLRETAEAVKAKYPEMAETIDQIIKDAQV